MSQLTAALPRIRRRRIKPPGPRVILATLWTIFVVIWGIRWTTAALNNPTPLNVWNALWSFMPIYIWHKILKRSLQNPDWPLPPWIWYTSVLLWAMGTYEMLI